MLKSEWTIGVPNKIISVTLTNSPMSTISNPMQALTGLHKCIQFKSHIPNGSPGIIQKPSVTDVMDVTDKTLFPSVTAKCPKGA